MSRARRTAGAAALTSFIVALAPTHVAAATQRIPTQTPPDDKQSEFVVTRDGFSFSNWGGLTASDALTFSNMQRLFGATATCKKDSTNPTCTLRSGQRIDLGKINSLVSIGRCEGMAVLAARLFRSPAELRALNPTATTVSSLSKKDAGEEIAYWAVTQLLPEIRGFAARTKLKSPYVIGQEVAFQLRTKKFVSLGIYGDGIAHTVLPVSATVTPRETTFTVYDPNFPGETRTLKINNLLGEWSYDSAVLATGKIGKLAWKGSGRLDYVPISLRPKNQDI